MSMIPDEIIEQVRDAADVISIIGESVDLKRTGSDWRGPCPFHGGTHRNFAVIPKKGLFYCYVCHEAGDVFSFYMKRLGMDYPTAVREVARRVGVEFAARCNLLERQVAGDLPLHRRSRPACGPTDACPEDHAVTQRISRTHAMKKDPPGLRPCVR